MIQSPERKFLDGHKVGASNPFFLIAGPCVIENRKLLKTTASEIRRVCEKLGIFAVYKASYDKANRSSISSYRGPGMKDGLKMLKEVKDQFEMPILTDVHSPAEVGPAAEVADVLQIPAFLSRQTDLLVEAAKSGRWVNVKKGQFIAPLDALQILEKFWQAGSEQVFICERGYTFGYNNLVVDMRAIEQLKAEGANVVMDCTHATQLPGGGKISGGQREMAFPLARAAAAVGVDGFFMEVHPNPPKAKSDPTNQLYLNSLEDLLQILKKLDDLVKRDGT